MRCRLFVASLVFVSVASVVSFPASARDCLVEHPNSKTDEGEMLAYLECLGDVQTSKADSLPTGVILAWYAKSGELPSGWAICDGTRGTPDLRDRFLRGVATFADVGIDDDAKDTHVHVVRGSGSFTTGSARNSNPDGWHVENRAAPHATGIDHTHKFSVSTAATSEGGSNIPRNVKVLYIMKIE